MFNLSYLSSDKKRLLERLHDRLSKATTLRTRQEIALEIQELEAQAKPYIQCDLVEADELRSQLLNKINILAGLGKAGSVEAFRTHLRDVEFHIQTLQMAEALKEQDKLKPEEGPNLRERSESRATLEKARKKKQAFGKERWLIGFEDEPDDEKTR
jgi:hypothetical protein